MADFIICVSGNLFRVYLISRFMHVFLDHGENRDCGEKRKSLLAYGGFFLVNTAAFLIFHMMWVNIVCNLVGIGLIALTYTRSIKMILFVTGSVYVINMGCDVIATLSFVDYKDGQGFRQIFYLPVSRHTDIDCDTEQDFLNSGDGFSSHFINSNHKKV